MTNIEAKKRAEEIILKHLCSLRNELRCEMQHLDISVEDVEMDRASDWINFSFYAYPYIVDLKAASDEDNDPLFSDFVSHSYYSYVRPGPKPKSFR